jgi:hypothetical protein
MGDIDAVVPFNGAYIWFDKLNLKIIGDWRQWKYND